MFVIAPQSLEGVKISEAQHVVTPDYWSTRFMLYLHAQSVIVLSCCHDTTLSAAYSWRDNVSLRLRLEICCCHCCSI